MNLHSYPKQFLAKIQTTISPTRSSAQVRMIENTPSILFLTRILYLKKSLGYFELISLYSHLLPNQHHIKSTLKNESSLIIIEHLTSI
jgi:hypothetical protein